MWVGGGVLSGWVRALVAKQVGGGWGRVGGGGLLLPSSIAMQEAGFTRMVVRQEVLC